MLIDRLCEKNRPELYNHWDHWDDKQKELYLVLTAPIVIDKKKDKQKNGACWCRKGKLIKSGQRYKEDLDEDMCDLAIEFYRALYGINILDVYGESINKDFVGDTMNNPTPFLVMYEKKRCKPAALKELKEQYHCLANFWILPLEVGRKLGTLAKGRKTTYDDFVDRFLIAIMDEKNTAIFNQCYPEYCQFFNLEKKEENTHWKIFASAHYIDNVYMKKKNGSYDVVVYSKQDSHEEIIKTMLDLINERAINIVESEKHKDLYLVFKSLCDSIPEEMLKTE